MLHSLRKECVSTEKAHLIYSIGKLFNEGVFMSFEEPIKKDRLKILSVLEGHLMGSVSPVAISDCVAERPQL